MGTTIIPETFLSKIRNGKTCLAARANQTLYSQGDAADAVYYLQAGRVKLSVISHEGKEAVVAMLEKGEFLGEACLTGQLAYISTATTLEATTLIRIEKEVMLRFLHDDPDFSMLFMKFLLTRNVRIQADLVDHLFNSAEKRLARILLLMAHFGKEGKPETVIPRITQETLAEMIGTTRSRVSFFLNKFRKLGFIEYDKEMHVHSSLLNVVLHD